MMQKPDLTSLLKVFRVASCPGLQGPEQSLPCPRIPHSSRHPSHLADAHPERTWLSRLGAFTEAAPRASWSRWSRLRGGAPESSSACPF